MKAVLICLLLVPVIACSRAAPPVANSQRPINVAQQTNEAQSVLAHSSEGQSQKPSNLNGSGTGKFSGGDPIDTSKFDAAIKAAEIEVADSKKAGGSDTEEISKAERRVADAYFARGFALTEARQYASALGDYRHALKYDPNHEEAKNWIDQIIAIYGRLKKAPPKEGDEPKPLPFKKEA